MKKAWFDAFVVVCFLVTVGWFLYWAATSHMEAKRECMEKFQSPTDQYNCMRIKGMMK